MLAGREVVRPRMLGVPGVAQVTMIGGDKKEFQVLADPTRMASAHVSLEDLARATGVGLIPLALGAGQPGKGPQLS